MLHPVPIRIHYIKCSTTECQWDFVQDVLLMPEVIYCQQSTQGCELVLDLSPFVNPVRRVCKDCHNSTCRVLW